MRRQAICSLCSQCYSQCSVLTKAFTMSWSTERDLLKKHFTSTEMHEQCISRRETTYITTYHTIGTSVNYFGVNFLLVKTLNECLPLELEMELWKKRQYIMTSAIIVLFFIFVTGSLPFLCPSLARRINATKQWGHWNFGLWLFVHPAAFVIQVKLLKGGEASH